jgi:hypothetical protein
MHLHISTSLFFPACRGPEDEHPPAAKVARVGAGAAAGVTPVTDGDGVDADPEICTCGVHTSCNWQRVAMLNDVDRQAALTAAMDAAIEAQGVRAQGPARWLAAAQGLAGWMSE